MGVSRWSLLSFTAIVDESLPGIILNWSTASETNNSGFEIERSRNQMGWEKIGYVPGYGTTSETKTYSFADDKVTPGKYSYRLKQIDLDGSFEYSTEVEIWFTSPNEFSLYQNYPNPFNPVTTIRYSIPPGLNNKVTLSVYDILGNEIALLVNEVKPAGEYTVEWDASNFSSGVYFYKLTAGSFSSTKKLLLMK